MARCCADCCWPDCCCPCCWPDCCWPCCPLVGRPAGPVVPADPVGPAGPVAPAVPVDPAAPAAPAGLVDSAQLLALLPWSSASSCCCSCSASRRSISCCQRCCEICCWPCCCCSASSCCRLASCSSFCSASSICLAAADRRLVDCCALSYWFFSVSSSRSNRPCRSRARAVRRRRHRRHRPGCRTPPGYRGRGFGAQQVLQRLLLRRQRVLPLARPSTCPPPDPSPPRRSPYPSTKLLKESPASVNLAGLHAVGQRLGLVAQLGLHAGQERGVFGVACPWRPRPLTWFQVAAMISFCRLRDLVLLAGVAAAAAAAAAALLRLRVVALERLRLDEEHVGAWSWCARPWPWRTGSPCRPAPP